MTEIKKEFKTKLEEFRERQEAEYKALEAQLKSQTKIEEQLDSVLKTENEDDLKIVMDVLSPTIINNIELLQDAVKLELSNKLSLFVFDNYESLNDEVKLELSNNISSFVLENFDDMDEDFQKSIKSMFVKKGSKMSDKSEKVRNKTFYVLNGALIKKEFMNLYDSFKKESFKVFEDEDMLLVQKKPYPADVKKAVVEAGFENVMKFFDEYAERSLVITSDKEDSIKEMGLEDFKTIPKKA